MIKIIQRRKIWFAFSSLLTIISIASLAAWGLKLGIDYTGGTLMEVGFNQTKLETSEIKDVFSALNLGDVNVQFSGEGTAILRFKNVDENTHQSILTALNQKAADKLGTAAAAAAAPVQVQAEGADGQDAAATATVTPAATDAAATASTDSGAASVPQYVFQKSFESIGPVVGNELKTTTIWAVLLALIGIVAYVAWAFRKVSYPVSSFKYGICATIALFHDVIITTGAFSLLGHFYGVEVGVTFLAAILAILGYSVNDTIVVFDRTRENLLRGRLNDFEEIVNNSVNETFARSLNTSFTTLIMLLALFLFGGASIQSFVLALLVGVAFGTYSSIFIASPLLVTWQQWDTKHSK